MYRKGRNYKIELKKGIFYTGEIVEEDSLQISIKTVRGEELVLNKEEIRQSKLMDSIGEENEQNRQKYEY